MASMLIAGRYETLQLLGTGGMGEVFLARDARSGQDVALKILKEEVSQDIMVRFDRECALLSRMSHPAVVRVLDRGTDGGKVFYAMEHVPWPTLTQRFAERFKQGRSFRLDEVLAVLSVLASALDHLHSIDVVHRDLKPSNLLVSDSLDVRVIDFGLAGMLTDRMTRTGAILGSMLYLSPEQVRADKSLDTRSDVFQTGLVLYEMLTGRKAYTDVMAYVRALRTRTRPFQPLHVVDARVPEPVSLAVIAALAVDPDERPASAGELHGLLVAAARGEAPAPRAASGVKNEENAGRSVSRAGSPARAHSASRGAPPVPAPRTCSVTQPRTGSRAPLAIAAAAVLACLVGGAGWWYRSFAPLPPVSGLEVTHGFFRTEMRWSTAGPSETSVRLSRDGETEREFLASAGRTHAVTLADLEPGTAYRAQIAVGGRPAGQPLVLQTPPAPALSDLGAALSGEGTWVAFRTPVESAAALRYAGSSGETGSAESSGPPQAGHRLLLRGFRPSAPFRLDFRLVSRLGEIWSTRADAVQAR
ncbi:MAG: protein kinase [Candidatus Wallbacteria bacterium]|nr:protein kinase [Candidatus Wallbacteria bacterium]